MSQERGHQESTGDLEAAGSSPSKSISGIPSSALEGAGTGGATNTNGSLSKDGENDVDQEADIGVDESKCDGIRAESHILKDSEHGDSKSDDVKDEGAVDSGAEECASTAPDQNIHEGNSNAKGGKIACVTVRSTALVASVDGPAGNDDEVKDSDTALAKENDSQREEGENGSASDGKTSTRDRSSDALDGTKLDADEKNTVNRCDPEVRDSNADGSQDGVAAGTDDAHSLGSQVVKEEIADVTVATVSSDGDGLIDAKEDGRQNVCASLRGSIASVDIVDGKTGSIADDVEVDAVGRDAAEAEGADVLEFAKEVSLKAGDGKDDDRKAVASTVEDTRKRAIIEKCDDAGSNDAASPINTQVGEPHTLKEKVPEGKPSDEAAVGALVGEENVESGVLPTQPQPKVGVAAAIPDNTEKESVEGPAVTFPNRGRKRSKKSRPRSSAPDSDGESNDVSEGASVATFSDVALLRTAQRLREQARLFRAEDRATASAPGEEKPTASEEASAGGLRSNFAVESSGYDAQRNMQKFIDERMVEKFGRRVLESRESEPVAMEMNLSDETGAVENTGYGVRVDEEDLYAIPEHLRVETRRHYDPTEGLPAAGVEEIDIGLAAKRRNVAETVAAHEELVKQRANRANRDRSVVLPGNLSANYEKHKRDWIGERAGAQKQQVDGNPPQHGGARDATQNLHGSAQVVGGKRRRDDSASDGRGRGAHGRRPPTGTATDHSFADRFRKRWRK